MIRPILSSDTLELGFRAKYNETIDELITGGEITSAGALRLKKYKGAAFYIDIPLLGAFYSKTQIDNILQGGSFISNASEIKRGILMLATLADVNAGSDDQKAITPFKAKASSLFPFKGSWIQPSAGEGYLIGAVVVKNRIIYQSLIAGNESDPEADHVKWDQIGGERQPFVFTQGDVLDLGGGNWYLPIVLTGTQVASSMRIKRADNSTYTKFPEEQDGKIFGFEDPSLQGYQITIHVQGSPASVIPAVFDLKIGGMAFGSASAFETFLKGKGNDFALSVTNYQDNGDGTESFAISNLSAIADYTFYFSAIRSFEDLTGIITSIGNNAFSNSTSFGKIISNSVTFIGSDCFNTCTELNAVSLNALSVIWGYAFANATSLNGKTISFPALTDLGQGTGNGFVFQNIPNLSLSVPNSFATNNAGAPDGDLTYIISNGGTINYL